MFFNRPHGHSNTSDDGKDPRCRKKRAVSQSNRYKTTRQHERTSNASGHRRDNDPTNRLKKVVGERNEVESISLWDTTGTGTRWPQSAYGQVGMEVRDFGKLQKCARRDFSVFSYVYRKNHPIKTDRQTYSPNSSTDPEEPFVIPDSVDNIG